MKRATQAFTSKSGRKRPWGCLTAVLLLILTATLLMVRPPAHAGNTVQAMTIEQLDQQISSEEFSGLVIAIASWCQPCKEELPELSRLYSKYNDQDIQIIAIGLDIENPKAIQTLVDRLNIPFPVYWVGNQAITHYKIFGVPTTLVVKKGEIIEKISGQMSRGQRERCIRDLVKQAD